ncbi:MAG: hypothetical protein Q9220_002735 [cf. Caloplaca sp. 1 TL-2023]
MERSRTIIHLFSDRVQAEGADWQRQRKLTATPFNEQKSNLVWAESLKQADSMLDFWMSCGPDGTTSTCEDLRTLALNVLAFAGFQNSYPWQSQQQQKSDRKTLTSYRDSLSIILRNILFILVLPTKAFDLPFMPAEWTKISWAISAFRQYMLDQVADERRLISEGKPGSGTLVSNLVRASETPQEPKDPSKSKQQQALKPLTMDEILGNIFVFNFAGHDTTSISLAYSVLLLVAHPEVQDWISEEINFHLGSQDPSTWQYELTFPKLKRCLAVLYETLRLYNPIPTIHKHTASTTQTLTLTIKNKQQTLHLPPHTLISPNLQTLHTHPRYWGPDSLSWRPSRWIVPSTSSSSPPNIAPKTSYSPDDETLLTPKKGTFLPFSLGLQHCPGQKFAQVEFVATIARVFGKHKAEATPVFAGEGKGEGCERVKRGVEDSGVRLLLGMRDGGRVGVRWVGR